MTPIEQAAEWIREADGLVIAAGAGMGVDSGLPDFRGPEGFWRAYPALGRLRLDFSQMASPQWFREDPHLAWGFYGHRLGLYRDTLPHGGFAILRRWADAKPQGSFVYTSNVDGQFQKAGWGEHEVQECHGSIHHLQCSRPCFEGLWPADTVAVDVDEEACRWRGSLPRCPDCDAVARPNILMFGDACWLDQRTQGQAERLRDWLEGVRRPVVVELGAGTHIPTVRHFSNIVCRVYGGRLVRINLRESDVRAKGEIGLAMGARAGLEAIDSRL